MTDTEKKLFDLFEPYLYFDKLESKLREDAPEEAVKAYMEYKEMHKKAS